MWRKENFQLGRFFQDIGLVDKTQTLTTGGGGNEGFGPARLFLSLSDIAIGEAILS